MATTKRRQYRSGLERAFASYLESHNIPFNYEHTKLKYVIPESKHSYCVDFDVGDLYIETKGRLDRETRKKMLLVKEQHPDKRIVFVFSSSKKPIYKGSPTLYSDWCIKNGFEFYDIKQLKENDTCVLSGINRTKGLTLKKQPKMRKPGL